MSKLRIAVVGCGAVTELFYLPAARLCPDIRMSALVDTNLTRAQGLAARFGVPEALADYRELFGRIDGIILATPHYLHAPMTIDCLTHGVPVLVEKPLALGLEEAQRVIGIAQATGVLLQVAQKVRFCNGALLVRRVLQEGWLGNVRSVVLEWGVVNDWPTASGFFFQRELAGGGMLIDFGSHMLDLLLWWFGDATEAEYQDDALGGVEAECRLTVTLQGPAGSVPGTVILSHLRRLRNTVRIGADHWTTEFDLDSTDQVRIWPTTWDPDALAFAADWRREPRQSAEDVFARQLQAFAHAITTHGPSPVPAQSVLGTVALVERCYRSRRPLDMPWTQPLTLPVRSNRA